MTSLDSLSKHVMSCYHGGTYACIITGIFQYNYDILVVAVSRGYDTCFSVKACDGLCQLLKSTGSG